MTNNNQTMRTSLIKSAIIVILLVVLAYLTSASPEGSLWNSLGLLFLGVFRAIQFSVGLFISLAICLLILFGIFLGAVAIVSKESAAKLYEWARQPVFAGYVALSHQLNKALLSRVENDFHQELGVIQAGLNEMRDSRAGYEEGLRALAARLGQLEASTAAAESGRRAETVGLSGAVASLEESLNVVRGEVERLANLEKTTTGIGQTVSAFTAELATFQSRLKDMHGELDDALAAIAALEEKSDRDAEEVGAGEFGDHRIFSYFADREQREKLAELVAGTLEQDMSYAQVIDHVRSGLSDEAAAIIEAHPSLMKDYIRRQRKKS